MKNVLFFSAIILFGSSLLAQDKWLAGSVGYSNSTQGDNTTSSFNISPEFGKMISEDLGLGINLNYMSLTDENDANEQKTDVSEFGINLFARKYKGLSDNFKLFAQLNVGYFSGETKQSNPNNDSKSSYTGFDVNIRPGIQYWVYDTFSILATFGELGYRTQTDKDDNDNSVDSSEFGLNVNGNLSFGLVWHF